MREPTRHGVRVDKPRPCLLHLEDGGAVLAGEFAGLPIQVTPPRVALTEDRLVDALLLLVDEVDKGVARILRSAIFPAMMDGTG
jgi:hypothetical protein